MKEDKIVSIVIPSYNMEDYLDKSLTNLIKAKEIDKIEIIIVNDGSKDNTLSIAKKYQEKAPASIVVIDKENGHYGSCLNAAMKVARGKYFRILDADDWFETDSLDLFVEKLSACNADIVFTLRVEHLKDENGELREIHFPVKDVEYGKVYDASAFSIKDHSYVQEFNMHCMTYKTELLRKSGLELPEGICYTDLLYCLIPLSSAKTLVVYDIYLYNYLMERDGNSTSASAIKRNIGHICTVLQRMFSHIKHQNIQELTPIVMENQMRYISEAFGMLMMSIRMQHYVSIKEFAEIAPVMEYCREYKLANRLSKKYYFLYWYRRNTWLSLNFCLFLYTLTHPFNRV